MIFITDIKDKMEQETNVDINQHIIKKQKKKKKRTKQQSHIVGEEKVN